MISPTVHNLQESFRTEQHQQIAGFWRNIKKSMYKHISVIFVAKITYM